MPRTYIAFIECVLNPNGHWDRIQSSLVSLPPSPEPNYEAYRPRGNDAELDLVDLGGLRRYFKFHNHVAEVRIVNNVVIFDLDDVEELAVDDSAKFPKKKRLDE